MFKLVQTFLDLSKHVQTCPNLFILVWTCSNLFKHVQTENFWICRSKFENLIHLIHFINLKLCNLSSSRKFLQFAKLKKISSSWRKFCQLEENLFKNCPNMFRLVQTCSNLSKHVQTCPNVFRLVQTWYYPLNLIFLIQLIHSVNSVKLIMMH